MTLEEAIQTALQFERKIRDIYVEASQAFDDESGRHLFESLAKDEQRHVDYLKDRLSQWRKSGKIQVEELPQSTGIAEKISKALETVKNKLNDENHRLEQQMLSKALKSEIETSNFYQEMVGTMSGDAKEMFGRFLAIENDHVKIVQAQLDYMMNTGYWFDIKEFDME